MSRSHACPKESGLRSSWLSYLRVLFEPSAVPLLEGHIHAIVDVFNIGNRLNGLLKELFEVVGGKPP